MSGLSQVEACGIRKSGSMVTPRICRVWRTEACRCDNHAIVQADAVSLPERPKWLDAKGWPVLLVFVVQQHPRSASLEIVKEDTQMR